VVGVEMKEAGRGAKRGLEAEAVPDLKIPEVTVL
jgi:hypothetical protein